MASIVWLDISPYVWAPLKRQDIIILHLNGYNYMPRLGSTPETNASIYQRTVNSYYRLNESVNSDDIDRLTDRDVMVSCSSSFSLLLPSSSSLVMPY